MQLTNDDVKTIWICRYCGKIYEEETHGCTCGGDAFTKETFIDKEKIQQVVAFYDKYKDDYIQFKLDHKNITLPVKFENYERQWFLSAWRDWLFDHCFKDGLK
jgi:hypothetical protein